MPVRWNEASIVYNFSMRWVWWSIGLQVSPCSLLITLRSRTLSKSPRLQIYKSPNAKAGRMCVYFWTGGMFILQASSPSVMDHGTYWELKVESKIRSPARHKAKLVSCTLGMATVTSAKWGGRIERNAKAWWGTKRSLSIVTCFTAQGR